jgi:uncharacterized membrane protein
MKHPIHFIMVGGAGCLITGGVVFIAGILFEKPVLNTVGCWFAIAAFAIASLPLFAVLVMSLVEKLRRK